jgi:hypothetical protein
MPRPGWRDAPHTHGGATTSTTPVKFVLRPASRYGLTGKRVADGCTSNRRRETPMSTSTEETGQHTGTKDKHYNLLWFTEQCLSNALRLETYIHDAEREGDSELADLFRRAQHDSRKGAEQGKEHLRKRLGS